MSLASASSSRCSRAAISTGCTSPLNARANAPLTAPSTFFSKRPKIPMSLLPPDPVLLDRNGSADLPWSAQVMPRRAVRWAPDFSFGPDVLGVLAFFGWFAPG
jgi:hypothetical protein